MRKIAEQIVDDLLEGRVSDWLADKWNDIKVATGIGQDEYGMGKPEKGFKPKYGHQIPGQAKRRPLHVKPHDSRYDKETGTWDIS